MVNDIVLPSKAEIKAELCRRSFYYFVKEFWPVIIPEKPVWNWHIEYFCSQAQRIIERLKLRLPSEGDIIINVPPGSTKTAIWSTMLPAWAWTIDPTLRILATSYSDTSAMMPATKARDIITSDKYQAYFPYIELKKDQNSKSNYENTRGGQRYSTGIGGTITGVHFHLIVIDDPLNPKQAASEADCRTACEDIDGTLTTRKVDKELTVTALIMQRLNENDPTAHLLSKQEKGKRIFHICLPAEEKDGVYPENLATKYVNGLLDPIRLSRKILDEALIDLGSANYAGQFAQRPAPAKGLIWNRWFIEVEDRLFPDRRHMTQYGTDWDTAYTKDDDNAASAYISAGKIGHKIYLDDLGWDWKEFPQLIHWMKTKHAPHYVEAKATGKSAKQVLVQNGIVAIEIQIAGGNDKIARANMATPIAEAGLVYIRKSLAEKLYSDAKQGILNFPRGKFKDLADVLAQCLQRLGKKGSINVHTGNDLDDD